MCNTNRKIHTRGTNAYSANIKELYDMLKIADSEKIVHLFDHIYIYNAQKENCIVELTIAMYNSKLSDDYF